MSSLTSSTTRPRLTLVRCALGILALGLVVHQTAFVFVAILGTFIEMLSTPGAGQGTQGYIGYALLSLKAMFTDGPYLQWLLKSAIPILCLTSGILLLRGPRFITILLRRSIA